MIIKRSLIPAIVLLLIALQNFRVFAQIQYNNAGWGVDPMPYSRVGTAGFQFLKLPTNARGAGMGGVSSAMGFGDARSSFTNPASIADVKGNDFFFGNMKWVADIQYNTFSYVRSLDNYGSIGINLAYLNYGTMVRTENLPDNYGNILPVTEGLGTFTAYDMAAGLSYSQQITEQLQIGGNIRFVQEKIDDAKTSTWSIDIGTLYWTGLGSWRISMLGKNFGPDAEFTSYEGRIAQTPVRIRMPMMFIFGTAYDLIGLDKNNGQRLTAVAEYIKPNDGLEKVNVGIEYFFLYNIYLRAGYRFNYDEDRFTFGYGFEYSIADDVKIKLDYAYMDLGRFNPVHLLTAGIGF
jgi:long-subunit fatty acid transport protein